MMAREWTRQARQAEDLAGTHIPFTAPLLSGVCVRTNRNALDFLLPNPSGGRGTYVVGWKTVAEYASPTLHDSVLAGRLAELQALEPAAVREVAWSVASEGYAGQRAAAAATRGRSGADAQRLRLWSRLLMALIDGSGLGNEQRVHMLAALGQAGPGIMTPGLDTLAKRVGWEPAMLFDALGRLSASHTPLCTGCRVPTLVSWFGQLRTDLARELMRASSDQGGAQEPAPPSSLRRLLADLDQCLRHARTVADTAMRMFDRPAALLESWRTDPAIALEAAQKVDRALDGWDRIALLWQDCATSSARLAVVPELALLLRLAADRIRIDAASATDADVGTRPAASDPPSATSEPRQNDSGSATPATALVERNERIRALELDLESAHA